MTKLVHFVASNLLAYDGFSWLLDVESNAIFLKADVYYGRYFQRKARIALFKNCNYFYKKNLQLLIYPSHVFYITITTIAMYGECFSTIDNFFFLKTSSNTSNTLYFFTSNVNGVN
jgi:hypothetical protein